jgi:hypothetical protein
MGGYASSSAKRPSCLCWPEAVGAEAAGCRLGTPLFAALPPRSLSCFVCSEQANQLGMLFLQLKLPQSQIFEQ